MQSYGLPSAILWVILDFVKWQMLLKKYTYEGDDTLRVLSVDFDYFINADISFKIKYFPDGLELVNETVDRIVWANHYAFAKRVGEDFLSIGVDMESLEYVRDIILGQHNSTIVIADSHEHIYDFVKDSYCDGNSINIEVYNIDFHHDVYNYESVIDDENVNCGNWLRALIDNDIISSAYWLCRNDSDKRGNDGYCAIITLEELPRENFDLVFICKSSSWTPPHLDEFFVDYLVTPVFQNRSRYEGAFQKGIDKSRYDDNFIEMIDQIYGKH